MVNDTPTMATDVALIQQVANWRGFRPGWLVPVDQLAWINAPTLWLWGSREPFGPVALGRSWATLMPRATFEVVDGAGHLPWLDDPAWHAARLVAFLGDSD